VDRAGVGEDQLVDIGPLEGDDPAVEQDSNGALNLVDGFDPPDVAVEDVGSRGRRSLPGGWEALAARR
jgi:hypothetical protein